MAKTAGDFFTRAPRRSNACLPVMVASGLLSAALCAVAPVGAAASFDYARVVAKARALAQKPYQQTGAVPSRFAKLDFSQWNSIRFKPSRALWQDTPFQVRLPPAGYLHDHAVAVNLIDEKGVHRLKFSPDFFDYDANKIGGPLLADLGFAGFRMSYPINSPDKQDEFLSFLGASYFRVVPKGGWFGLSARGLAIDSGMQTKEEFPRFTTFWLRKPAPDAKQVTIYALLDSPSVSGAYRFIATPGNPTRTQVKATIYCRRRVKKLGLAPLTSMYFYGVGDHKPADAPHPADHDSDGLLLHTRDGRWQWRALANPDRLATVDFAMTDPAGFGLMQRDRRPQDYQAPEMHYARRPSAWIRPHGRWGPGHVQLVEVPTTSNYNDNIVAFWVPNQQPAPNQPLRLSYAIDWRYAKAIDQQVGRVVSTLIGGDASAGTVKYVIDYAGGRLNRVAANNPPRGIVETDPKTKIVENRVERNPHAGGWRQVIQLHPLADKPVTVHAYLSAEHKMVSERWGYTMAPRQQGH